MIKLNELYGDLRSIKGRIEPDYLRQVQNIIRQVCDPMQRDQMLNYAITRNNLQTTHELSSNLQVFYCGKVGSTSPVETIQYAAIENRSELENYILNHNLYPNLYGIFIDFSKQGFEDYKEIDWLPPFSLEGLKIIGLRRLIINQYILDVIRDTEEILLNDCKLAHSVNLRDQVLSDDSFKIA